MWVTVGHRELIKNIDRLMMMGLSMIIVREWTNAGSCKGLCTIAVELYSIDRIFLLHTMKDPAHGNLREWAK